VSVCVMPLGGIVAHTAQDAAQTQHAYEYSIQEDAPRRQQYEGVQLLRGQRQQNI
jgi:hypothetical protein